MRTDVSEIVPMRVSKGTHLSLFAAKYDTRGGLPLGTARVNVCSVYGWCTHSVCILPMGIHMSVCVRTLGSIVNGILTRFCVKGGVGGVFGAVFRPRGCVSTNAALLSVDILKVHVHARPKWWA